MAGLQALIAFGFALALIVSDIRSNGTSSAVSDASAVNWIGTGTAVFIFIVFGVVFAGALSLLAGRGWGRTPLVMISLLLLPISFYMASESLPAAGIALGLSAVVCLVCVLHPRSTEHVASLYRI
ncbi:hypothetical protein GCM10028828_07450 [Corynebacterium tapiri]